MNCFKGENYSDNICKISLIVKFFTVYYYFANQLISLLDMSKGRDWGQEEKGTTEDEMAGWHHWLDGRESEWTPGVGDGQGGLACCDSWGHKESDTTERLIWSNLMLYEIKFLLQHGQYIFHPKGTSVWKNKIQSCDTWVYIILYCIKNKSVIIRKFNTIKLK